MTIYQRNYAQKILKSFKIIHKIFCVTGLGREWPLWSPVRTPQGFCNITSGSRMVCTLSTNNDQRWQFVCQAIQSSQRVLLRFDACALSVRGACADDMAAGCSTAWTGIASIVADVVQLAESFGA